MCLATSGAPVAVNRSIKVRTSLYFLVVQLVSFWFTSLQAKFERNFRYYHYIHVSDYFPICVSSFITNFQTFPRWNDISYSLRTYAACPVHFSHLYLIIKTRITKLLLCVFFHFPFYENKRWVGAVVTRLSRIRQVLCFEIGPYFSQFLQADYGIIPLITFN